MVSTLDVPLTLTLSLSFASSRLSLFLTRFQFCVWFFTNFTLCSNQTKSKEKTASNKYVFIFIFIFNNIMKFYQLFSNENRIQLKGMNGKWCVKTLLRAHTNTIHKHMCNRQHIHFYTRTPFWVCHCCDFPRIQFSSSTNRSVRVSNFKWIELRMHDLIRIEILLCFGLNVCINSLEHNFIISPINCTNFKTLRALSNWRIRMSIEHTAYAVHTLRGQSVNILTLDWKAQCDAHFVFAWNEIKNKQTTKLFHCVTSPTILTIHCITSISSQIIIKNSLNNLIFEIPSIGS